MTTSPSLRVIKSDNFSSSSSSSVKTVIVFVHGLDSSSKTWEHSINHPLLTTEYSSSSSNSSSSSTSSSCCCIAIDQRGCGYSSLGNIDDFSQQTLVQDLHTVIQDNTDHDNEKKKSKVILVGHSLGGRIVLSYAATYPQNIAAVIIEDMDIAQRNPTANAFIQINPSYDVGTFMRQQSSKENMISTLQNIGYPFSYLEKCIKNGRIEPTNNNNKEEAAAASGLSSSSWYSHINPDFRILCYRHILSTGQGRKDCEIIASLSNESSSSSFIPFPLHLLVADKDSTVCMEESIEEMQHILSSSLLTVHRFPNAGHSIHSTASEEYHKTLRDIIISL